MNLKRLLFIFCISMISLCGCGQKQSGQEQYKPDRQEEGNQYYFTHEDLHWQDNSLDAYSASFSYQMDLEKPEGEYFGYLYNPCFGTSEFRIFQSFVSPESSDIYQCTGVTNEGIHFRKEITEIGDFVSTEENTGNSICCVGSVWGSNQYAVVTVSRNTPGVFVYQLTIWNEDFEPIRTVELEALTSSLYLNIDEIFIDEQERLHVIARLIEGEYVFGEEGSCEYFYKVIDADGKLLQNIELNGDGRDRKNYLNPELRPFWNGRVGVCCQFEHEENGKTKLGLNLLYFDIESGEEILLASNPEAPMDCTLWAEDTILFADGTGVYLCDLQWQNVQPIYLWKNHSFAVTDVRVFLDCGGEQKIHLFCRRNEEIFYRELIPTTKEVPVTEINFAIKGHQMDNYEGFVRYFNQKYPACKVNIDTTYTDTKLRTELITGEGPVLIDTLLTGFEEQVEYWEPLDDFLEITGLENEIYEPILQAGRVRGKAYGILTDFGIDTVLTRDKSIHPATWNYESFIEYVKQKDNCKAIFLPDGNPSGMILLSNFFTRDMENCYWLKNGKDDEGLHVEHMAEIFDLIDTYCQDSGTNYGSEQIENGEVLFCRKYIGDLSDLYREVKESESQMICLGYPTKNGAVQYLTYRYPLTIRNTASAEEKRVAFLFLREFLSYEGQLAADKASINFRISVREDAREAQIRSARRTLIETESYGLTEEQLENMKKQLDETENKFREILSVAQPKANLPKELVDILWEEVYGYIEGELTRDMALQHMSKRVELFVSE